MNKLKPFTDVLDEYKDKIQDISKKIALAISKGIYYIILFFTIIMLFFGWAFIQLGIAIINMFSNIISKLNKNPNNTKTKTNNKALMYKDIFPKKINTRAGFENYKR